jgi:hypothetical protein
VHVKIRVAIQLEHYNVHIPVAVVVEEQMVHDQELKYLVSKQS